MSNQERTEERTSLLSSESAESTGREFDTFPNVGQIQQPTGALETGATTPKKRYRCDNFLPCDPRRWMHRQLMLTLMGFLSLGEEASDTR